LLIVSSNRELEEDGRSISLLGIADLEQDGLMPSERLEGILYYSNPYPSIYRHIVRQTPISEDRAIILNILEALLITQNQFSSHDW